MDQLEIGATIVAITEAIKRTVPQVNGVYTILVAAALGLIAGLTGINGLNWMTGLATGFASSGVVTTVSKVSK